MTERPAYIPISKETRTKLKSLKGTDDYDNYLNKLLRTGANKMIKTLTQSLKQKDLPILI